MVRGEGEGEGEGEVEGEGEGEGATRVYAPPRPPDPCGAFFFEGSEGLCSPIGYWWRRIARRIHDLSMTSRATALSMAAVGSAALILLLRRRRRSPRHRHLAWVTRLLAERRLSALHREIYVAANLALECGAAMERATAGAVVWKDDGGIDPVTATDQANETLVTETLLRHFPDHRVVGEEAAAAGSGVPTITAADPPTWYVDPIDGTQNFVHSLPISCVSIGLAVGGVPVLGVICDLVAIRTSCRSADPVFASRSVSS